MNIVASQMIEKSRHTSNLIMKCKFCGSQGSVDLDTSKQQLYRHEDVRSFKPIIHLECRGWEPKAFVLGEGWKAKALHSNHIVEGFSLEDFEWVDYDENSAEPMEVFGMETKIDRG